ncbi:MAG TPA: HDIG domain-containing protein, partial [Leptospiraceae bacterium]|nr:HDIG domain-containing protein [Leptospiraceae bacterium]
FGQTEIDLRPNGPYTIGSVSTETVISRREINYIDENRTQAERAKAYNSGAYIFERDFNILTQTISSYINEEMDSLKNHPAEKSFKNIAALLQKNQRWKNKSREDLEFLVQHPRKDRLKELVTETTGIFFTSYCIMKDSPKDLSANPAYTGKIYNKGHKEKISILDGKHILPREVIYRNQSVMESFSRLMKDKFPSLDSETLHTVKRLSLSYIYSVPACTYRPEETDAERALLSEKVKPVISKIERNERIVRAGEIITPEARTKLEQISADSSKTNISSILSVLIVQIIFVAIISAYLKKYDQRRLNDLSSNIIIFSLLWTVTFLAFILSRFYYHPDSSFDSVYYFAVFVPIGMVGLLIGFIYDEQLAVAIGFYISFVVFLISMNNVTSFVMAFSTTVISSVYGNRIRKRLDFLKIGFLIAGIQMLVATSGYLLDSRPFWNSLSNQNFLKIFLSSNILKVYLACLLNGFACATAAQFLLPILEYLFNIPTRFKLLELADTGHPLLQALLTKAPSTYTHTFLVAAMSERAAQNLGLDWLLVRVGVYFHDIGKIPNAGFFVENQHLIPKKEHIDRNNPGLAAKIVIDHVLDGIEMAKKARLPREVISFIPEHHGTSTMAFFYHKALAELSPNQRKKIRKKDFQYPGPKPQRKETAIVMIADSVEAASRSLDTVSAESLEELIQKIIGTKLAENQLDECGLTLGDLNIIKNSFKEILLSSLHQRPKYPNTEETKKLEKENQTPVPVSRPKKAAQK